MTSLKLIPRETTIPPPTRIPKLITYMTNAGNRTSSKDKLQNCPTDQSSPKTFEKLKDPTEKFEGISDLFKELNLVQLDEHEKINSLKESIEHLHSSATTELKVQILDLKGYNESIRKLLDNAQLLFESVKLHNLPHFEPMENLSCDGNLSASQKHFINKHAQTFAALHSDQNYQMEEQISKTVNACPEKSDQFQNKLKKDKNNSKDAIVQTDPQIYKILNDAIVQTDPQIYKNILNDAVVQTDPQIHKNISNDAIVQTDLPVYKNNSNDAIVQTELPTLSINIKLEPQPNSAMKNKRNSLPGNFTNTIQPALLENPELNALANEKPLSEVKDIQIGLGLGSPHRYFGSTQLKNRINQKTIATQTTFVFEELMSEVQSLAQIYFKMSHNFKKFREFASLFDEYFQETFQEMEDKFWEVVNNMRKSNKELARRYKQEMALRKKYHNELMQLKGNIRVFCRIRPPIVTDEDPNSCCISVSANDRDIIFVKNKNKMTRFEMDTVFHQNCSQSEVFDEIRSLVTSCIDGFNVCILAYGQTGSGKTYTMEGTPNNPGMNQRALKELFRETALKDDWNYSISVSMLEIYNEQIRDLLNENVTNKLEAWNVQEVTVVPAYSVEEVNKICAAGHKNRIKAATNLNSASSRSHALLCVRIEGCNETTNTQTKGKLYLIDLAGSENVEKSGVDGQRLKEAGYINKSLSTFSDVINAILLKRTHIPYRNSKLTHLLQDSLGGNSKTLLLTQVAPGDVHVSETIQTLQFAQRIRSIQSLSSNSKSRERLDSDRSDKNEIFKNKEKTDDENSPEPMSSIPPRFSSMFLASPMARSPKINGTPSNQTKRRKSLTSKLQ